MYLKTNVNKLHNHEHKKTIITSEYMVNLIAFDKTTPDKR
jgi:hypothetical protein